MPEKSRQDGLQGLANLATLANYFQLRDVAQHTEEVKQILDQQQRLAQHQSRLRQGVFEAHTFVNKKLPEMSDQIVARMGVDLYQFVLRATTHHLSLIRSNFRQGLF